MASKNNNTSSNFIKQAGILAMAGIIVRIIGILYRSPLVAIIGDKGNGYYNTAYVIYTIILLVSSYSIPSAISKVIAARLALGEHKNAHRLFIASFIYVTIMGTIGSLVCYFFADKLVRLPWNLQGIFSGISYNGIYLSFPDIGADTECRCKHRSSLSVCQGTQWTK